MVSIWTRKWWGEAPTLTYVGTTAHVIEVLTEKAGNLYKAFLRKPGISYIIAGTDTLDYGMAMEKLKTSFGIETLLLGGNGNKSVAGGTF